MMFALGNIVGALGASFLTVSAPDMSGRFFKDRDLSQYKVPPERVLHTFDGRKIYPDRVCMRPRAEYKEIDYTDPHNLIAVFEWNVPFKTSKPLPMCAVVMQYISEASLPDYKESIEKHIGTDRYELLEQDLLALHKVFNTAPPPRSATPGPSIP